MMLPIGRLQYCKKGRQSVELIWALRRMARQAAAWRDVERKVLDHQTGRAQSLRLRQPDLPASIAGDTVDIEQTNGVRQGSPDSPSLFSAGIAGIGEALDEVTAEMHGQSMRGPDKESQRIPPAPHGLSAFMDDAYVWGASPEWIQRCCLLLLERALAKRGLRINPGKTFIMASKEPAGSFQARRSKRMAQQL
eukprot:s1385_g3.t1